MKIPNPRTEQYERYWNDGNVKMFEWFKKGFYKRCYRKKFIKRYLKSFGMDLQKKNFV